VTCDAVIGLGASLGDRARTLRLAVAALDAALDVEVIGASRLYRTVPLGPARGWFLNGAVRIRTRRSPRGLLALCKQIEARLGRVPTARWSDRVVDLDILIYGDRVRRGPALALPHPGLVERAFALVPAAEVAPDLLHPVLGRRLDQLPTPRGPAPLAVSALVATDLARAPSVKYTGASELRPGPGMKLFLDTANVDEIRRAASWGVLDGVTTNPSLVAREGRELPDLIHEICEIVRGPVSAETVSTDAEGMIRQGRLLARVHPQVVVKVPMSVDGLRATRTLSDEGVDVNVTLVFSAAQALLAARAGAAYISPFVGRLDDQGSGSEGLALVEQIAGILRGAPELGARVLAASIRSPARAVAVALAGAHVATLPLAVLEQMARHPLTDQGLASFLSDWSAQPDSDLDASLGRWLAARGA